ncbi:substrate-binding periplasmic protein [Undibacterium fentianense]|uniref:Transporter substrate-binding domain-containing protein n=1 Tax=Undibacterium fentianense TaxID=2828728 RepID=A0A941E8F4_9BURK|nr:transporter substrate-binding domain-containing protein [Undibacterium fentianense]MBR7800558.1 transporter substrate-binding domain-containing protein [Undibacterium fentianense]
MISLLSFLFLLPQLGFATSNSVLKVVTSDLNFPYNFVKDQRVQGLSVDVAEDLARRMGMRLEVELVPWTRALHTARMQSSVMLFTVARIPEREENYYWIGPVTRSEEWLYKLKRRSEIKVRRLDDVRQYLVGDEANNASLPVFARIGVKVDTAPSMLSNCRKLKAGRVDLIPFDPDGIAAFGAACDLKPEELEKTVQVPRDTALYFAFGKSTPIGFIRRVETTFAEMVKDKTLIKMSKRWKVDASKK